AGHPDSASLFRGVSGLNKHAVGTRRVDRDVPRQAAVRPERQALIAFQPARPAVEGGEEETILGGGIQRVWSRRGDGDCGEYGGGGDRLYTTSGCCGSMRTLPTSAPVPSTYVHLGAPVNLARYSWS